MAKNKKSKKRRNKKRVEIRYETAPSNDKGILAGLKNLLPEHASEQFVVGLLIGGVAAYVLSDEKLRRQVIRYGMLAYTNLASSVQELKEQVADIGAEILAEQTAAS